MPKLAKTLAAAAACFALAPAAVAQPHAGPDLARYDAAAAPTLGAQLVLCDLADFFATGPDLRAHRVFLRRDPYWFEPTLPTSITRGAQWHDEDLEHAYMRHRRAGRVSAAEVAELRSQYGLEMERAFERSRPSEQRFFARQAPFCHSLARGTLQQSRR